jgi:hypothetical protein
LDHCDALKQQLAYLEDVGGDDRPTFTFAHVLAPHSPILTDADGNCIDEIDYPSQRPNIHWEQRQGKTWEEFTDAYSGYVDYINGRFLEIFDRQRSNNPNRLIFVLQSDEGPFPKAYREYINGGPVFDWRKASDAQLAMKYGILNALYLGEPDNGGGGPAIPGSLTPVNNWRVIFSHLEGRTYPLLPDRHFMFPTEEEPFHSIEITDRLKAVAR